MGKYLVVELLIMDKYMSDSKRSRVSKVVVPLYTPTVGLESSGYSTTCPCLPLKPSEARNGQRPGRRTGRRTKRKPRRRKRRVVRRTGRSPGPGVRPAAGKA